MNPQTNLRVSPTAPSFPGLKPSSERLIQHEWLPPMRRNTSKTSALWLIPCAALAVVALACAVDAYPQQPYPGAAYDNSGSPYQSGQYAPPAPQNGYAPPQVQLPPQQPYAGQPQQGYPDPQQPYAPDQQPEYAPQPPQYAPQYSAPQQPYTPEPYADQQPNGAQMPAYAQPDQGQTAAPTESLSAQDLEQLLAPIALYPDSLLAQILAASTYPAEVAIADQWVQQMRAAGYGSPDQIAAGANEQTNWDPSVKALTAFPDVLDLMNHDLEWTTNLGNAYYNQPQDVMQTVQVLRQRAEQAGNLQSTPQEDVQNDQGYIDLAPANPQVVYVPTYNPWAVYGQPIAPYPGFSFFGALGNFFGGVPIQYGLSFALGAFDRMPFGWLAWGLDWLGHAILFDHSGYYTHSREVADWGLPRGGPRAYGRGGSWGTRNGPYPYSQRQGYSRGGNDQRGGWSNDQDNRGRGGVQPYARPAQDYSRAAPQNYGYRPQTYPNRAQTYVNRGYESRPQAYSNPGYGYGYTGRTHYGYAGPQNYATRPGFASSNQSRSYRAPQDYSRGFSSRGYSNRSYESYGNTMARNERSGGFRPFGGGAQKSFNERAPKFSYKAPRSFGGGHESFGGGHMSAPKMGRSSGGGHRR
jgi:hypothetical protein